MTSIQTSPARPRRKAVLGNWKMHGSLAGNATLLQGLQSTLAQAPWPGMGDADGPVMVGVAVPFPYLPQTQVALQASPVVWGAQDVSPHVSGAYTGEVSAGMLAEMGCAFVLVGHSERRAYHGESHAVVASKASAALEAGLTPVVCFGETLEERESGRMLDVMRAQLEPVLALGADAVRRMIFAYEPVWAIGTGKTATPEQAQEVHAAVRLWLQEAGAPNVAILYGGSVKAANAASLFDMADIDGGLVGGAALDAAEFCGIIRAAVTAAS